MFGDRPFYRCTRQSGNVPCAMMCTGSPQCAEGLPPRKKNPWPIVISPCLLCLLAAFRSWAVFLAGPPGNNRVPIVKRLGPSRKNCPNSRGNRTSPTHSNTAGHRPHYESCFATHHLAWFGEPIAALAAILRHTGAQRAATTQIDVPFRPRRHRRAIGEREDGKRHGSDPAPPKRESAPSRRVR